VNRFLICGLFVVLVSFQSRAGMDIDSLRFKRNAAREATDKIELDLALGDAYHTVQNLDSAQFYFERAAEFATEMAYLGLQASAFYGLGEVAYERSNGLEAITYLNKALAIEGGLDAAIELEIYNIMGVVYLRFGEGDKAILFFDKALAIQSEASTISGESYEFLYNNKGITYVDLGMYDSARFNHQKCLSIRLEKGSTFGIGQSYNNLGTVFYELNVFDSALVYYQKGLDFRTKSEQKTTSSILESQINIAKTYIALNDYLNAEKLLETLESHTEDFQSLDLKIRLYEQLMELNGRTKNYERAYSYARNYYHLKDSLYGIDQREELIRMNLSEQYAEKKQQDSLIALEKLKYAEIEKTKEDQIRQQNERESNLIQWGLIIALLLMGGILILIFRNFRSKKRASDQILLQKKEVEKQRDIAQSEKQVADQQRVIAQRQKMELEYINQEITDSINYAKRIQNAILPSDNAIQQALKAQFVLYIPKAIVAGDFYWVRQIEDRVYFAAADCTGHGVPGALVSIVCSNALNRAVEEFNLVEPGEILDKATDLLLEAFVQSDEDVKDGMDIALCCLDRKTNKMSFAGANNPLYIVKKKQSGLNYEKESIQNDTHILIEVRGNKQSVGYHDNRVPFKTMLPPIDHGDMVYSFSDGFPDQFGGVRGKKYKYKQLKYFLLQIATHTVDEQRQLLSDEFHDWKGDLEQVDDICIFGYRANLI